MKTALRRLFLTHESRKPSRPIYRWFLNRELRKLKREIDYVFQVRRETVRRETQLRRQAERIAADLMNLDIEARRA
ncbi:hypothetical protein AWB74_02103 [Caballeronia arvi]|uniref:Uncharacterized protein n=1 Tax=Caballeronia arvi TaxID=1777135 RepID=A0A158HRS2_9BURK|nr:hypothetical protein [Caballeronia arvi]SAL47084.1 hypothetical protein AWB74_02103 [Caballeronia arvi]